jgi:hypothetical protein
MTVWIVLHDRFHQMADDTQGGHVLSVYDNEAAAQRLVDLLEEAGVDGRISIVQVEVES